MIDKNERYKKHTWCQSGYARVLKSWLQVPVVPSWQHDMLLQIYYQSCISHHQPIVVMSNKQNKGASAEQSQLWSVARQSFLDACATVCGVWQPYREYPNGNITSEPQKYIQSEDSESKVSLPSVAVVPVMRIGWPPQTQLLDQIPSQRGRSNSHGQKAHQLPGSCGPAGRNTMMIKVDVAFSV